MIKRNKETIQEIYKNKFLSLNESIKIKIKKYRLKNINKYEIGPKINVLVNGSFINANIIERVEKNKTNIEQIFAFILLIDKS